MTSTQTLPTDVKYRDPFLQSGFNEKLVQQIDLFNGKSSGTIKMVSNRKPGDYDYAAFFKNAGGLVTRQDQTSVAAVDDKKIEQDELAKVKLNRKIGPVKWSRSAALKAGLNMDAFKIAAGEQAAVDASAEMLNTGLAALQAAISNQAALKYTVAANGTIITSALVNGIALLGDRADRIAAWVMHSKQYFDLIQYQIAPANNGDVVANTILMAGSPATLNRPVIVTDSDSLKITTGTGTAAVTDYYCLGLSAGALELEDSEEEYMTIAEITGQEQIMERLQGEFAYNLGVKGFTWDVANGGKNPTGAAVATGTNWDKKFTSIKDLAGVVVKSR